MCKIWQVCVKRFLRSSLEFLPISIMAHAPDFATLHQTVMCITHGWIGVRAQCVSEVISETSLSSQSLALVLIT